MTHSDLMPNYVYITIICIQQWADFIKLKSKCQLHKTIMLSRNKTNIQALLHYSDVIMSAIASQITGLSIVCTTVCSGAEKTSKLRITGLRKASEFPA